MLKSSRLTTASGAGAVRVGPVGLRWPSALKRYRKGRALGSPVGSACTLCASSATACSMPRAAMRVKASSSANSQPTSTCGGKSGPDRRVHNTLPDACGWPEAMPMSKRGRSAARAWRTKAGAHVPAAASVSRCRRAGSGLCAGTVPVKARAARRGPVAAPSRPGSGPCRAAALPARAAGRPGVRRWRRARYRQRPAWRVRFRC